MSIINAQFGKASPRLVALRELLAEKFPATQLKPGSIFPTGWTALDEAEGGLRRGAVTELVGSPASGGLFIGAMLSLLRERQCFAALVDANSAFDPRDCDPLGLQRLLWVMCTDVKQSIRAVDLLLRDANLPLVMLDLQMVAPRQLQSIPASTWHRFLRLVEKTSTTFVALSCQPMVEAAQVRIAMKSHWGLEAMRQQREALCTALEVQVFPRREFSMSPMLAKEFA